MGEREIMEVFNQEPTHWHTPTEIAMKLGIPLHKSRYVKMFKSLKSLCKVGVLQAEPKYSKDLRREHNFYRLAKRGDN